MNLIIQKGNKFILRFDRGEELISGLAAFCQKKEIRAAFLSAIGAAQELELSFYDLEKKKYSDKNFHAPLEVCGLTGNIAQMAGKIIIHAHGCFSDAKMRTIGGHIKKLVVAGTCEVLIQKFKGKIERRSNEETGLNLMK
jgi:predicted DNA-binding protein with PD1-like motif